MTHPVDGNFPALIAVPKVAPLDGSPNNQNDVATNPSPEYMPYQYVDFGRSIELDPENGNGVHTNEFYHVAIRWHDGTTLRDFIADNNGDDDDDDDGGKDCLYTGMGES